MTSPGQTLPRPAPLHGPTTAASMLVGATGVVALLDAVAAWHYHGVAADYVAGRPGVWVADLTSADSTARTIDVLYLLTMAAAGIAVLVWLSRTRANARLLGHPAPAGSVRAIAAWFGVCVVAAGSRLLHPESSVEDLSVLATIASAAAVLQCVAGTAVVVVVRRLVGRGLTRETASEITWAWSRGGGPPRRR
jgi:hypothetical protein